MGGRWPPLLKPGGSLTPAIDFQKNIYSTKLFDGCWPGYSTAPAPRPYIGGEPYTPPGPAGRRVLRGLRVDARAPGAARGK